MHRVRSGGYTLLEVMIVAALLSGICLVTSVVLVRSTRTWRVQEAQVALSSALRDSAMSIRQEMEEASWEERSELDPPVAALAISGGSKVVRDSGTSRTSADARINSDAVQPTGSFGIANAAVTFHAPLALDGESWSVPITIRLRNEDLNHNLVLDLKEDLDGSGTLDRLVERVEDRNGDGDLEDPGEVRILGVGVDGMTFTRNDDERSVSVELTGRERADDTGARMVTDTLRFTVHVKN